MLNRNKVNTFLVFSIIIFAILGCSTFTKGKEEGEKAVKKFHIQLNNENFEEIYNESAKEFQDSDNKEEIIKFLSAVRRKLGKVTKTSSTGWKINTTTSGTVLQLSNDTEFEQDRATESFTFYLNGDDAKLAGYHVNSKKLITE